MLYNEIFKYGHWVSFIHYVNEQTGCFQDVDSITEWIANAEGKEDTQLEKLFSRIDLKLIDLVNNYFQVSNKQLQEKHCLRCTKQFEDFKQNNCNLCGWVYDNKENINQGIQINRNLNTEFIQLKAQKEVLSFLQKSEEAKLIQVSNQCNVIELEIKKLEAQVESIERKKEDKKILKQDLEEELQVIQEQEQHLQLRLKNSESLFLPYESFEMNEVINLRIESFKVTTVIKPEVEFPIDLIMGLQKKQRGVKINNTIRGTSFFVFLHIEDWINIGTNKWELNLRAVTKGKGKGEFYVNQFSHLHKKDHPQYQIRCNSKKTIRI